MTEYHIVPRASSAYRTLRRFCLRKLRSGRTHRVGSGVCRYLRDRAESARCEHIRAVTHHVEFNASAEFMEQYIMNMNFNVL